MYSFCIFGLWWQLLDKTEEQQRLQRAAKRMMAVHLEAAALIYETNLHYQWWELIHETDWLVSTSSTEWDTPWELSLHLALHAKSILAPKYQVVCARWPYASRALIPWMKSLRPQQKRRKTLSRPDQQRKQRTRGSHYFGKIFWDPFDTHG